MASNYIIFDLDNCLSADSWRVKYIKWNETHPWKRYETYHRGCGMDEPKNLDIFREMTRDATPVFLTGRPILVRPPTIWWINNHLGIEKPILIMRNNDDHRPSVQLKEDMLKDLNFNWDIFPNIAFDDRPEIVEMYEDHGIDARHLYIVDPDLAYRSPEFHLARRSRYLRWKTGGSTLHSYWDTIIDIESHLANSPSRLYQERTTQDWIEEVDRLCNMQEYELFCQYERTKEFKVE